MLDQKIELYRFILYWLTAEELIQLTNPGRTLTVVKGIISVLPSRRQIFQCVALYWCLLERAGWYHRPV